MTNQEVKMTDADLPPDETLNEVIAKAAESRTDEDLASIVAGLRTQSERWNLEQAKGSRKRVTSKKIAPPKSKVRKLAAGLGKITL